MIPVVFSTDHNFIMPTYVAISSMLANSSRRCKIYLLIAEDVTDNDKDILSKLITKYNSTIEFISVGNVFDDTFIIRGITFTHKWDIYLIISKLHKIINTCNSSF